MNELGNIINMVSDIHGFISNGVSGIMAIVFALVAVAGLFQCFFGYKLMRACFAICGFGIGALGGLVGVGLAVESAAPAIIAALVLGVLGALLLFHVYRLGVFVMNFALVALLVLLFGNASNESLVLAVVAGLISGIVAAIMVRIWTILSTGIAGGMAAGLAIGSIISVPYLGAILGFAFAIGGTIFQFKTTGKKEKRSSAAQQPVVVVVPAAPAAPSASIVEAPVPEAAAVQATAEVSAEKASVNTKKSDAPRMRFASLLVAFASLLVTIGKTIACILVCLVRIAASYICIAWFKLSTLLHNRFPRLHAAGK